MAPDDETRHKLPELIGATEVAKLLGTSTANLRRWPTLPPPLYELRSGRLYDAAEIRRFAKQRARSHPGDQEQGCS